MVKNYPNYTEKEIKEQIGTVLEHFKDQVSETRADVILNMTEILETMSKMTIEPPDVGDAAWQVFRDDREEISKMMLAVSIVTKQVLMTSLAEKIKSLMREHKQLNEQENPVLTKEDAIEALPGNGNIIAMFETEESITGTLVDIESAIALIMQSEHVRTCDKKLHDYRFKIRIKMPDNFVISSKAFKNIHPRAVYFTTETFTDADVATKVEIRG